MGRKRKKKKSKSWYEDGILGFPCLVISVWLCYYLVSSLTLRRVFLFYFFWFFFSLAFRPRFHSRHSAPLSSAIDIMQFGLGLYPQVLMMLSSNVPVLTRCESMMWIWCMFPPLFPYGHILYRFALYYVYSNSLLGPWAGTSKSIGYLRSSERILPMYLQVYPNLDTFRLCPLRITGRENTCHIRYVLPTSNAAATMEAGNICGKFQRVVRNPAFLKRK